VGRVSTGSAPRPSEENELRSFQYLAPQSIDETVRLLAEHGDRARLIAGGTDIVVQMKESATRFPYPQYLVSVARVPGVMGMEFAEPSGLRIGAAVTMAEIAESPLIRERYAALAEGAGVVGSLQTMNMATIGGNLCNAAPSADTAPALLALGAKAVIVHSSGRRIIPIEEFFAGPGTTVLGPAELLTDVLLPAPTPRTGSAYRRHTPRKQMDIAVVGVAAAVTLGDGNRIESARIALGAVAPTPVRAPQAEASLAGQTAGDDAFARAAEIAAGECSPISDQRGTAEFRRHLVRVMTERMLREAAARAMDG